MSERLRISELVRGGFRPSTTLIVSGVASAVALLALGLGVRDLAGAVFSSSVSEADADPLSPLTQESTRALADARKRFDGRSVFVMPSAPVRRPKAPPTPLTPPPPPPDPGPPPPPSSYTGPMPTSILGDIVFFASNMQIRKGQTINGVTVIETHAPWEVKLGHMRGEYTVPIWSKGGTSFFTTNPYPLTSTGGFLPSGAGATSTAGANAAAHPSGALNGGTRNPALRPDGTPITSGSVNGAPGSAVSSSSAGSTSGAGNATSGTAQAAANANANHNPTRGAPPLAAPGDEPGADQPQGPGPGDEPGPAASPAMEPLDLPAPPPEPPSDTNFVDPATLPPPISDQRIGTMDMEAARNALAAIDSANSLHVDPVSRDRLDNERIHLLARIEALQGGSNP